MSSSSAAIRVLTEPNPMFRAEPPTRTMPPPPSGSSASRADRSPALSDSSPRIAHNRSLIALRAPRSHLDPDVPGSMRVDGLKVAQGLKEDSAPPSPQRARPRSGGRLPPEGPQQGTATHRSLMDRLQWLTVQR